VIRLRAAIAATALLAIAIAACGGPTPAPTPSPVPGQPTGGPGEPSPTVSPGANGSPAADLLPPEPQPALPGIYLPAGFLARGTDHFTQIQAPTDCATLTDVLGAGQWAVTDDAHLTIPTPGPGETAQPMPDLNPPNWLLLRWGDQIAVARIGGDETGCLAQIWRMPELDYEMHGAIESTGRAVSLQVQCVVGAGAAELAFFYFGEDGTLFSVSTTVPLKVGNHDVPFETEVYAGSGVGITVDQMFPVLYGGQPEPQGGPQAEQYGPNDPASGWEGSIAVTSIEPLTGQLALENLRNAAGETLSLTADFRCDLRPGALSRAAEEAANATPTPAASPSPQPGFVRVEIASGPHAGVHEATGPEATCAFGFMREGEWMIQYSAPELIPGELQSLSVSTPQDGGKSNVQMFFGDDYQNDWFSDSDANGTVDDYGTDVQFTFTGRAAGSDYTITFDCFDILRF
jgi:hypothetical protein